MPRVDSPRTPSPKLRLSRLRDIGWSLWDPIGLMRADRTWHDEECLPFADEYDSYLVRAAGRLRRGDAPPDVAHYLAAIEVNAMGLGGSFQTALARAERVVEAMQADTDLWTSPDR